MLNKVVIAGGGTAGWMAALAISSRMKGVTVEVIDPEGIPAIGVGESVTGVVQQFVSDPALGLDIHEFFRKADATLKMGIWYKGWQCDDSEYLTPIDSPFQFFKSPYPTDSEEFYATAVADGIDICESQIYSELMRSNRTDYLRENDGSITAKFAGASCQFDALKFAAWLKEVCSTKDEIIHTNDVIEGFEQEPESGWVTSVITESGRKIEGEFFIDCTGFHRKLFEPAFAPKWIDYSRFIKLDSAIPNPTDYRPGQKIPSYTSATAADHGWMWQVPTQSRLGTGYAFSSRYVDDEAAVEEMRAAGCDPGDNPRIIRFQPGRVRPAVAPECMLVRVIWWLHRTPGSDNNSRHDRADTAFDQTVSPLLHTRGCTGAFRSV